MSGANNSIGDRNSQGISFDLTLDFSLADDLVNQSQDKVHNLVIPGNPRDYRETFAQGLAPKEKIKNRLFQIVQDSSDDKGLHMDWILWKILRDHILRDIIHNNQMNWHTMVNWWGDKRMSVIIQKNIQENKAVLPEDYRLLLGLISELHEKLP